MQVGKDRGERIFPSRISSGEGIDAVRLKRFSDPRPLDTQRTPTHTHRLPGVRKSPGRSVLPSTRHRITLAARVRKQSDENRSHVQKFSFSGPSSCVLYPRHTTHIRASAFPFTPAITIARYHFVHFSCCVFSISPFRIHGATELRTLHLNFPDLLSFVSSIIREYDNPES